MVQFISANRPGSIMARKWTAGISQKKNEPTNNRAASTGCCKHIDDAHDQAMLDHAARPRRHAAHERCAGPGQREQKRPGVVHDHVLNAVEEELMLGEIFELGFQHRVKRDEPGEECDASRQCRPLPVRRQQKPAHVPPGGNPASEKFHEGEIPRRPNRQHRRVMAREPPSRDGDDGNDGANDCVDCCGGTRRSQRMSMEFCLGQARIRKYAAGRLLCPVTR